MGPPRSNHMDCSMAVTQKSQEKILREVIDRILVHLTGIDDLKPVDELGEETPIQRYISCIPMDRQRDVLRYRSVNKTFNDVYKDRFHHGRPSWDVLPPELKEKILDYLVPKPNILTIDTRSYLSLESFASVEPGAPYESDNLSNFALVNRQCRELGLKRQFARLTVDFSLEGFNRLQRIAEKNILAKNVLKLSYMVPRFYLQGRPGFERLLADQQRETETLERQLQERRPRQGTSQIRARLEQSRFHEARIKKQMEKAESQRRIVGEDMDFEVLKSALQSFKNLQQIRLMPLENENDRRWYRFLKRYHAPDAEDFSWAAACERAVNTLVEAVLQSNSKVERFSCRLMILQTPLSLTRDSEVTMSTGIARLKCLELHVVDRMDLAEVRAQLSGLCKEVLRQAVNLEGLHIGFRDRVSLPLEAVFNNVRLEKLKYAGIHMWSLHDEEVTNFLRRHRNSLKALRLRNVYLKEGSRWDRILRVIRQELKGLKWISLRGIGYFDTFPTGAVFDDSDSDSDMHLNDTSESNEEDDEGEGLGTDHSSDAPLASQMELEGVDVNGSEDSDPDESDRTESDETEDIGSESDGENDGEGSEVGQALHDNFISDSTMVYHSTIPESPVNSQHQYQRLQSDCACFDGNGNAWNDLDDDGIRVGKLQWKRWERWAVKRCELHDEKVS